MSFGFGLLEGRETFFLWVGRVGWGGGEGIGEGEGEGWMNCDFVMFLG